MHSVGAPDAGLPAITVGTIRVVAIAALAFVAGSIPFSNIAAHVTRGTDLRDVGTGTVSGTGLYRVAGVGPLVVAGILDVAKGAVGPLAAGTHHPGLQAVCCALAVAGHDWSPWLHGAGGRGVSTAMGALLVVAWGAAALLLAALAFGAAIRRTGLMTFVAIVALPLVAWRTGRADAAVAALLVAGVMLTKRAAGNTRPQHDTAYVVVHRVLFDHDPDAMIRRHPA